MQLTQKQRKNLRLFEMRIRLQKWIQAALWVCLLYAIISFLLVFVWVAILSSWSPYFGSVRFNYIPLTFGSTLPAFVALFIYGIITIILDRRSMRDFHAEQLDKALQADPFAWRFGGNKVIVTRDHLFFFDSRVRAIAFSDISWICLDKDLYLHLNLPGIVKIPASSKVTLHTRADRTCRITSALIFTHRMEGELEELVQYLQNRCPYASFATSKDYTQWKKTRIRDNYPNKENPFEFPDYTAQVNRCRVVRLEEHK